MSELKQILDSIRGGDKAAFEVLYEGMKKPLFTIILRITQDFTLSEDILQELFLKIYFTPHENTANPRAYLCQMARNLAIDSVRKQKQEAGLEEAESRSWHPQESLSANIDIENALLALSDRDRQIVTLHINGGLKFREIAATMGIPLGTVLWAYRKAIGQLRGILAAYTQTTQT